MSSTRSVAARRPDRAATEAALMDAAFRLLERDGVLAGLNLQEVADEARVNRGLIHHYFGSRRALLRAALDARKRAFAPLVAQLHRVNPWKRGNAAFREYGRDPRYAQIVMLLALDGDEQFEPLAFLEERLADWKRDQEAGVWTEDADHLALLVVFDVLLYGWFVLRPSVARQLGMSPRTLDRRILNALGRMYQAFAAEGAPSPASP
ncbi:MAG TPA: helix-turn-helix domain-containing protein [Acidimicrobiales bacterium]|nr:helix-turn-helix domain-containing protein [Acidimicrobiales bacterium]